jgi:predicted TIM-barrel fold metal-dependent hydrolase
LKTASSYVHSYVSDLLRGGHPLLDLAACLDIPVLLHCSILSGDPWANVFDQCLQVARSRPDVRFALAHTCRFDRRALEAADALPNCFVDFSAFHIHARFAQQNSPVVAKKRFRFPADYRDHAGAMAKIAEAYPNTMLWGTDTPYHYCIGRWVDANGKTWLLRLSCDPDIEGRELRKLPSSLIRRITYTNTLRFLFGG